MAPQEFENDDLDIVPGARPVRRENTLRARTAKVARPKRRVKKAAPGSIHLRRNKHWSW